MSEQISKLAKALADGFAEGHARAADEHHAAGNRARTEFMELLERELAESWRERGLPDFNAPHFSEEVRKVMGPITDPSHQTDFFWSLLGVAALAVSGGAAAASGWATQIENHALETQGDKRVPLPMLTDAYRQGLLDYGDLQTLAKQLGYQEGQLDIATAVAEPWPSIEAILTLWRRFPGIEGWVDTALRRLGYSEGNAGLLKALVHGPPPLGTVVAAETQGQVTKAGFSYEDLVEANGIDRKYAGLLYETEGATMPPDMANRLFREGKIDLELYEQILLESRLKNKYVPYMKLLRFRVPPMRITLSAYRQGNIDRATADDYLSKLGFDVDVREWMLDSVQKVSGSGAKHLSLQQEIALYEADLRTREQVTSELAAVGWDADTVDVEIRLAEHRKTVARQTRAANRIGTRYVTWRIDRTQASNALDSLGLPAAARDDALEDWDIQREAQHRHLTEAHLKRAFKKSVLTVSQVETYLRAMGYSQEDAKTIIDTDFS